MRRRLTVAEINHLRRLLGWVGCEIGQSPDDFLATMRSIAPKIGTVDGNAKERLVHSYRKAESVPKYVRAAVCALRKVIQEDIRVVDGALATERTALATTVGDSSNVEDAA